MKKPVQWIRCPRCELNWIQKKDKYCSVCKAEMKANGNYDEFEDESEDLELCPICKSNYINEGEDMCPSCAKLREKEFDGDDDDKSEDWKTYIYEKEDEPGEEDDFEGDLTVGNADDSQDAEEEEDDELNIPLDDIDDDDDIEDDVEEKDKDDDDDDELNFDDIEEDSDDDDDDNEVDDDE